MTDQPYSPASLLRSLIPKRAWQPPAEREASRSPKRANAYEEGVWDPVITEEHVDVFARFGANEDSPVSESPGLYYAQPQHASFGVC
jgi:hypothetical protein